MKKSIAEAFAEQLNLPRRADGFVLDSWELAKTLQTVRKAAVRYEYPDTERSYDPTEALCFEDGSWIVIKNPVQYEKPFSCEVSAEEIKAPHSTYADVRDRLDDQWRDFLF